MLRKQDQTGDTCTYEYDLAGRMTRRDYRTLANSPSGTIADSDVFTCDKASRMLTAVSGRYTNTMSLVGDWNSVTTNGIAQARTHGPSHELLTGAGGAVSTDVKGNITVIPAALRPSGVTLAMTWDFDNRMATAVTGSTTVSHKYDALGRRVARTEGANTTICQQTLCDYVAGAAPSASTYRYLFASYIDEPVVRITTSGSVATYLHRNQQYLITALTNSTGTVVERYAYTAYGVPTITDSAGTVLTSSAQNNRYLYTGREWDGAISLYHYRARMYDASLGRFCFKDPIGHEGSEWNLYEYVAASPTVFVDPFGLQTGLIDPKVPYYGPLGPPIYTDEWYPDPEQPNIGGLSLACSGALASMAAAEQFMLTTCEPCFTPSPDPCTKAACPGCGLATLAFFGAFISALAACDNSQPL